MIELWSWPAPAGQQVHILLEETGLPYTATPVDTEAAGFNAEFAGIAPNYRVPAMIDPQARHGRLTLSEPGAILIYLAEKAGNFIPVDPAGRYLCLQWLMFQLGGIGPAVQHYHRLGAGPGNDAVREPFSREVQRLLTVLEKRLEADDYLAGTYSIADMAAYPWIAAGSAQPVALDGFPATRRWAEKLAGRPAVERGMALMQELQEG